MSIELGAMYILDEPIGRGASGEVWRGHSRDGSQVAVKMLRRELLVDGGDVTTRFLRERDILVALDQPNVVSVIDMVAEGGKLGIVMELVEGGDLRRYLNEHGGRLSPELTCGLMAQVAQGLAAAHAAQVVHRDLKPENVLVDSSSGGPVAKITDFGIARMATSSSLTASGGMVGTPLYAAPEVGLGTEVGPAADVYAVGVMAYELLAGHPPFRADNPWALMRQHHEEAPGRPPGVPDGPWAAIASCLAKKADRRPVATALASTFRALAPEQGSDSAPGLSQTRTVTPTLRRSDVVGSAEPPPRAGSGFRRRRLLVLAPVPVALLCLGAFLAVAERPFSSPKKGPQTSSPSPGRDWVAFTFDDLALGRANTTTQISDTSGNGNIGLLQMLPPGEITVIAGAPGGGNAIKFPGPCTSSPTAPCPRAIVQTADPSILDAGDRDFSYGADVRVQPAEAAPGAIIIQKGRPSRNDDSEWKLQLEGDGKPSCVAIAAGTGLPYKAISSVTVADGAWHEVRCTRTRTALRIEVDDTLPGQLALPSGFVFASRAPLRLGGTSDQQENNQFSGALDDVFFRVGST